MRGRSIAATALALVAALLLGNDGVVYEYPDGSGVVPITSAEIQMVEETVTITNPGELRAAVEARFTFRNLTDRAVTVTMGFPFRASWGELYFEEEAEPTMATPEQLRFVSLVDGVEVPTRYLPQLDEQGRPDRFEPTNQFVWDVAFAPGQRRELVTRYVTEWERSFSVMDDQHYSLTYITTTGAGWAGRIERAVFSVEIPAELPRPAFGGEQAASWSFTPELPTLADDGRVARWELTDWEPAHDVAVFVDAQRFGMSEYVMLEALAEADLSRPWDAAAVEAFVDGHALPRAHALQVFVNGVYARAGHRFRDDAWTARFERHDGYTPARALTFAELPAASQATVTAALALRDRAQQDLRAIEAGPYGCFLGEFGQPLGEYTLPWCVEQGCHEARFARDPQAGRVWARLARNAFYARLGRTFQDPQLAAFFGQLPWYHPTADAPAPSDEQLALIAILREFEQRMDAAAGAAGEPNDPAGCPSPQSVGRNP